MFLICSSFIEANLIIVFLENNTDTTITSFAHLLKKNILRLLCTFFGMQHAFEVFCLHFANIRY